MPVGKATYRQHLSEMMQFTCFDVLSRIAETQVRWENKHALDC